MEQLKITMMKHLDTFEQYMEMFNELQQLIDDSMKRNDMIIFDQLSKCLADLKFVYPQFENKRLENI